MKLKTNPDTGDSNLVTTARDMLFGALATVLATVPSSVAFPWDHTLADLNAVQLYALHNGKIVAYLGYDGKGLYHMFQTLNDPLQAPQHTYYVRQISGNDANDGLTFATAKKSIFAARIAANAFPNQSRAIKCDASENRGIVPRNYGIANNGTPVNPNGPEALISFNGTIMTGSFVETVAGLAADVTYPSLLKATRGAVTAVLNLLKPLPTGGYAELQLYSTPALAHANMGAEGSWALSGTDFYMKRSDGLTPVFMGANANTMVVLNEAVYYNTGTPQNTYMGGEKKGDGWVLVGGNALGPVAGNFTARPPQPVCAVFENVSCVHTGGVSNSYASRGASYDSMDGVFATFNCRYVACATDGKNSHYFNAGAAGGKMYDLMVNDSAYDLGRGNSQSCNPGTLHEGVLGAAFGCVMLRGGGAWHNINTSRFWGAGLHIKDDLGDIPRGGAIPPTAFRVSDTAKAFLQMCFMDMPPGGIGLYATQDAEIFEIDPHPASAGFTGPGTYHTEYPA